MKVLVCGSRRFEHPLEATARIVQSMQSLPDKAVVIHGDAPGADRLAGEAAKRLGLVVIPVPADWNTHSDTCKCSHERSWCWEAGRRRNLKMLDMLTGVDDWVLAFWNGHSTGTKHTISNGELRGLFVERVMLT